MIEALLSQQPENESYLREHGIILTDLADVLRDQGKYSQAREAYEEALNVVEQLGDSHNQAVVLSQLGMLALLQRDFAEAKTSSRAALERFRYLGEPTGMATVWHQLGRVAEEQQAWAEAERCYRESLAIKERLGNAAAVEAEGWYMRGLELYKQTNPGGPETARSLNNLAVLLVNEMRAGRAAANRLTEAKRYAEQALAIRETLDASSEIWGTLGILAEIADLEGHAEEARNYRRRERETFAAFAGNRYHIDQQFGPLIAAITSAAKGDAQAREEVETVLPQLEEGDWKIAAPIRRIWSGERDWDLLVEEVDREDALLILRVLETIAQPKGEATQPSPEEIFATLPATLREALSQGDEAAFQQAFEALSPQDQQAVVAAIESLQAQAEEESESPQLEGLVDIAIRETVERGSAAASEQVEEEETDEKV